MHQMPHVTPPGSIAVTHGCAFCPHSRLAVSHDAIFSVPSLIRSAVGYRQTMVPNGASRSNGNFGRVQALVAKVENSDHGSSPLDHTASGVTFRLTRLSDYHAVSRWRLLRRNHCRRCTIPRKTPSQKRENRQKCRSSCPWQVQTTQLCAAAGHQRIGTCDAAVVSTCASCVSHGGVCHEV